MWGRRRLPRPRRPRPRGRGRHPGPRCRPERITRAWQLKLSRKGGLRHPVPPAQQPTAARLQEAVTQARPLVSMEVSAGTYLAYLLIRSSTSLRKGAERSTLAPVMQGVAMDARTLQAS